MNIIDRRKEYTRNIEIIKCTSIHIPDDGIEITEDRKRCPGDITHDYSTAYGWINRRNRQPSEK